jgi:hypothetical protein
MPSPSGEIKEAGAFAKRHSLAFARQGPELIRGGEEGEQADEAKCGLKEEAREPVVGAFQREQLNAAGQGSRHLSERADERQPAFVSGASQE